MGKHVPARVIADLESLYRRVPALACQRKCGAACGPVILTDVEARRLREATHVKPRTLPMVAGDPATVRCVYLSPDHGRCTAHAIRPLICRAWGTVKRLSCPHGCVPERWLSDHEFLAIAQAVEAIGGGRVLRTAAAGLEARPGESFASLRGLDPRPVAAVEADAERVRGLRAIFGGRILAVVTHEE